MLGFGCVAVLGGILPEQTVLPFGFMRIRKIISLRNECGRSRGGKGPAAYCEPSGEGETDPGSQDGWLRYGIGHYAGNMAALPAVRPASRRSF
jgi:hypothetical protein